MALRMSVQALSSLVLLPLFTMPAVAGSANTNAASSPAQRLQRIVNAVAAETVTAFARSNLQTTQLASALVAWREPQLPSQASSRVVVRIYPASVIKLFEDCSGQK